MKFVIAFLMAVIPALSLAQTHSGAASGVPSGVRAKTTAVLVILTPKKGVTPGQIVDVIPAEIRATVELYLEGKVREWYSRGDGKASSSWSTRGPRTRREPLWERCPSQSNS